MAPIVSEFGMSESQARRFLKGELERHGSQTFFYWESEELEDLLDLMVEVLASLIEENNRKLLDDLGRLMQ